MTPRRIQLRRAKGWRIPTQTMKVDRSTPFGNPFPVSKGTSTSMGKTTDVWMVGTWDGPAMWFEDSQEGAIKLSVKAFRAWLEHTSQSALLARTRNVLRGKNLACWCKLCPEHRDGKPLGVTCEACAPCHADVLLACANADAPEVRNE